jgi:hypothetical protein
MTYQKWIIEIFLDTPKISVGFKFTCIDRLLRLVLVTAALAQLILRFDTCRVCIIKFTKQVHTSHVCQGHDLG